MGKGHPHFGVYKRLVAGKRAKYAWAIGAVAVASRGEGNSRSSVGVMAVRLLLVVKEE